MEEAIHARDVLLIFDLDGTLYRTESSFVPTMQAAYAEHGIPYAGDDAVMAFVGEPFDALLGWLISQGFPHDVPALAEEIASSEYRSIARDGELYPDVVTTLRSLVVRGFRMAICTNGDARYVDAILGKFGLRSQFDRIATHGDARETKTVMVAGLVAAFRPRKTLIIGDRRHDFEAGRANQCTVVAATYGFADDWKSENPDVLLDRFADLPAVVDAALSA
jgi:phosphoglycolate phosphatase